MTFSSISELWYKWYVAWTWNDKVRQCTDTTRTVCLTKNKTNRNLIHAYFCLMYTINNLKWVEPNHRAETTKTGTSRRALITTERYTDKVINLSE